MSYHSTKPLLKQILIQRSYASIAKKRKGASVFFDDMCEMMKSGPLRDRVRAIERPGFLNKSDFDALLEEPDYFLWSLLTFDIFETDVLREKGKRSGQQSETASVQPGIIYDSTT